METYIANIKKVSPVYHATKNRKLKGDVDSYLASANLQQEALEKNRRKRLMHAQSQITMCSFTYSSSATEIDYEERPHFDQKA